MVGATVTFCPPFRRETPAKEGQAAGGAILLTLVLVGGARGLQTVTEGLSAGMQ